MIKSLPVGLICISIAWDILVSRELGYDGRFRHVPICSLENESSAGFVRCEGSG